MTTATTMAEATTAKIISIDTMTRTKIPTDTIMEKAQYYLHQFWIDIGDPRTADYPMVGGGMWKIASVLITYWLLVKLILPAYMRDRKPYSLKIPIRIFNALMVMVNLAAFIQLFYHIDYGRRFLDFSYPDRSDNRPETLNELYLAWIGYMSRYLDMFDTIFFCLRKKHNQITFLHVYHHMVVPFLGWFSFKLNPLIPIIALFAIFNTAIHVIMYSYYTLASFGPEMQKYLWWKKYITQLQLVQFAACGTYGIFLYFLQTGYPMIWFVAAVGQNPIFFYMFYDFYRQAYNKKQQQQQQQLTVDSKKDQ